MKFVDHDHLRMGAVVTGDQREEWGGVITLLATMFGYKPIMQKQEPPWMPAQSVLGQFLASLEKRP